MRLGPKMPIRAVRSLHMLSLDVLETQLAILRRVHPQPAQLAPCRSPFSSAIRRAFNTQPALLKKSAKSSGTSADSTPSAHGAPDAPPDPHDLTALDAAIVTTLERLDNELKKLRPGGRVSPEDLDALKVSLPASKEKKKELDVEWKKETGFRGTGPGMYAKDSARLADLAQVVPRGGRGMIVMVGEKEHVRPVHSAILASPYPLTPSNPSGPPTANNSDTANSLELLYTVPPPTTDSRTAVLETATSIGDTASSRIRDGRAAQQKRFRALELGTSAVGGVKVRGDELRKARAKMDETIKKGEGEVKRMVEACRRKLETG